MKMNKIFRSLILSLGMLAIVFTVGFTITTTVSAFGKCRAEAECPNGTKVYCELDAPGTVSCTSSGTCVTCSQQGQPAPEPTCCGGGGDN